MDEQHTPSGAEAASDLVKKGKSRLDDWQRSAGAALDQAKTAAEDLGTRAQEVARQAQDTMKATTDTLYEQGTQARDYVVRNVETRPLTALLAAAAIGYGLAYLIHRN